MLTEFTRIANSPSFVHLQHQSPAVLVCNEQLLNASDLQQVDKLLKILVLLLINLENIKMLQDKDPAL